MKSGKGEPGGKRGGRRKAVPAASLCAALLSVSFALFPAFASAGQAAASPEPRTVTIGLVDTFPPDFYIRTFSPTIDHLERFLPEYRFRVADIDHRDVLSGIEKERPDFVVSAASTHVALMDRPGAHQVATRLPANSTDAAHTAASAVVVRKESPARSIRDLKGAAVAVSDLRSFDGWLIAQGEIAAQGFDPDRFFSETTETRYGIPDVAALVEIGAADAGILSTCELERLIASGRLAEGAFRVLDEKSGGKGCARSTAQYPDAVIASMPWVTSGLASQVTIAILSMPEADRNFRWVVESNFQPTWNLLKTLRIGPFSNMRDMSPRAVWLRWRTEILLGLALLAAVLFHLVSVNLLVQKRTRELSLAVRETRRLHEEARLTREKLAGLERASIVAQLSSMFAHEIKQPVMNIALYAGALRLYLRKKGVLDAKAEGIIGSVEGEIDRSSEIVEHVRSYAKKREARPELSDLGAIAESALRTFSALPAFVTVEKMPESPVWVDPFEIQFIVANFVQNAVSAVKDIDSPSVRLSVAADGDAWRLTVADNGPEISDAVFARLGKAGASTKAEGLGFGLAIATAIAERNRGHLEFRKRPGGGLAATLVLSKFTGTEEGGEAARKEKAP